MPTVYPMSLRLLLLSILLKVAQGQTCSKLGISTLEQSFPPLSDQVDSKLPKDLEPIYYDLIIKPHMYHSNPKTFTFNGFIQIRIRCIKATNKIILNSRNLNIIDKYLEIDGGTGPLRPTILNWTIDRMKDLLVIQLDSWLLTNDEYSLRVRFTGRISHSTNGLYYSKYKYKTSHRYIVAAQLEPTFARNVFPCFDEPVYKAYFNLTIIRKSEEKSLSNMPRKRVIVYDKRQTADIYETTPLMSTHLLAFIVGHMDELPDSSLHNLKITSWTSEGKTVQTNLALDVSVLLVKYLELYFGTIFTLKTLDLVAVPDVGIYDTASWGLTVFREGNILYTPGSSAHVQKQDVVIRVAHKITQQWYNLVSPASWNELWLNKALARFVGILGIDHYLPTWKMLEQLVVDNVHVALNADGFLSSSPLQLEALQLPTAYDPISNHKGTSIIRMLKFILGDRTFKTGLKIYLRTFAYNSVNADDLWDIFTKRAKETGKNIDVKSVMDSWTLTNNYPVVTMKRVGNNKLKITQKRFLYDQCAVDLNTQTSLTWDVPVTFTTSSELYFNQTNSDIVWISKRKTSKTRSLKKIRCVCGVYISTSRCITQCVICKKEIGDFEDLFNMLNNLDVNIKFTIDCDENQIPFLDVLVERQDKSIITDLYFKSTDTSNYFSYRSCHLRHVKNSIPFSLAKKTCAIVIDKTLLLLDLKNLKRQTIIRHHSFFHFNIQSKARRILPKYF